MPTARYGSMPRKVMSMGLMTAAALIPAKPVPRPAPIPAKKQTSTVIKMCMETSRIAKHTSDTPHCKTLSGKVNGEDFPVY